MERKRYLKLGTNLTLQNYRLSIKQEPRSGYTIGPIDIIISRCFKNSLTIHRLKINKLHGSSIK